MEVGGTGGLEGGAMGTKAWQGPRYSKHTVCWGDQDTDGAFICHSNSDQHSKPKRRWITAICDAISAIEWVCCSPQLLLAGPGSACWVLTLKTKASCPFGFQKRVTQPTELSVFCFFNEKLMHVMQCDQKITLKVFAPFRGDKGGGVSSKYCLRNKKS